MDCIKMVDCIAGGVYKIHSRNLGVGVYDGKQGFIGIREKFKREYLFTEYHYEQGPPYGTVHPKEFIGNLPSEIPLEDRLCHEGGDLWAKNIETMQEEGVVRRNPNLGEAPHGMREGFVDEWLISGKRLPDGLWPYMNSNTKLFDYLKYVEAHLTK